MAEHEIVGWHHRLDGYEFGQALGDGGGQGNLGCGSPWGHKELDTTEQLNNNNEHLLYATQLTWFISFNPHREF